jgi:hypothetical protein
MHDGRSMKRRRSQNNARPTKDMGLMPEVSEKDKEMDRQLI